MKKSIKYWEERSTERESLYQAKANKTIAEIQKAYDRAFFNIEKEFLAASRQFELKGGFSAEDAEAYVYRMNRLKAMQKQVYTEFAKLREIEERTSESLYVDLIEDSFYRNIFDIQRGTGLGFTFNLIPEKSINEILRSKWKGRNYSDSIWRNTGKLASIANEIITAGFTAGTSIQGMTKQLNDLGLHELKETGKFVAERLIRTEVNYFANQGELKAYEECGIEKYRYVATLDVRTSELCRNLDGIIEAVKNAVVGDNYPPMHPFCRSTTIAVIEGETLEGLRRKARDPVTGKTYTVPADMTYKEWYKEYVAPKKDALLAEQMQKNRASDKMQHEKYAKVLGSIVPKTLKAFQDLKYNDSNKYNILKAQYKGMGYYNKALENEPAITGFILEQGSNKGLSAVGLDYRIKSKDSFLRKIRTEWKPGFDYEVKDIIRYTYVDGPETQADKIINTLEDMSAQGYNTIKIKNYWLNEGAYKGINTQVKAPNGQIFELQYHTKESFDIKDGKMHRLYEEARLPETTPERRSALEKEMKELSEGLIKPKGIERVK